MLSPDYLDRLPDNAVKLYEALQEDIIAYMSRLIAETNRVTDTVLHEQERAKAMGMVYEYILQEVSARTYKSWGLIQSLFEEAGAKTLEFDDHVYEAAGLTPKALKDCPELLQLLWAGMENTKGVFQNLSQTTASAGQQQFIEALDRAWMQTSSGAFSYEQSIRQAVKDLSQKGVKSIQYPSGHVDFLDVAVRRALLTGVNQASAKLSLARADQLGCDLVETTAHAGARPTHQVWQGRIFSRSGKHPKYPDFVSSTGYGTGAGLCGWNCRHNFFPFFEGASQPAYSAAELASYKSATVMFNKVKLSLYEATQMQRYNERQIRKWKREASGMNAVGDSDAEAAALAKVGEWQARQRDFLEQTGLDRDYFREQTTDFTRSQSSKAVWANRNAEKAAINRYISGESYLLNAKLRAGIPLSKEEQQLADTLERAILKLPKFEGIVYRSLRSEDMDDWEAFNRMHQVGYPTMYPAFTSTGKTVYDNLMDVQLIIQSKNGRDLKGINDNEQEVLFPRGAMFFIERREGKRIWLKEI